MPADTRRELERCFRFARTVYRNDPNWVEPILADRLAKVDPGRNPFWRTAERRLWMALRGEDVAGTIAAIHDRRSNEALHQSLGTFGFFECLEDPEAAGLLVDTAAAWLATRGLSAMRGPYNPSADDEPGILVEGFDTLPAIMEGHAPPYYARLLEGAGMRKHQDMFARLIVRPPGDHPFLEDAAPRLRRAIEIAGRRDRGVVIRTLDRRRWDEDIRIACRLFNAALAYLPEHVPVSEEEFLAMAEGLKPILDDELALLAEVDGRPAGFALVLPDVNQALRHVHGRLGLIGTLRFLLAPPIHRPGLVQDHDGGARVPGPVRGGAHPRPPRRGDLAQGLPGSRPLDDRRRELEVEPDPGADRTPRLPALPHLPEGPAIRRRRPPMKKQPAPARLPLGRKIIYGLGDWGDSATSTIFIFFFAFFLTDIARLPLRLSGLVLLVGGIWDAVNDPLIGVLVDRVRTRWGRRRPFFLFDALPLAVTFTMLWWVPPWGDLGRAAWFALAYILFDTCFTLMTVPYGALTAELTEDYDERTNLTGWRMALNLLGGLMAAFFVPVIVGAFTRQATGYFAAAAGFGLLAAVPYLMLFFTTKERFAATQPPRESLVASVVATLKNRSFRYTAAIYLLSWVTVNLVASLLQYYVTWWVRIPDQLEFVLVVVQGVAIACIPLVVLLSGRSASAAPTSWRPAGGRASCSASPSSPAPRTPSPTCSPAWPGSAWPVRTSSRGPWCPTSSRRTR